MSLRESLRTIFFSDLENKVNQLGKAFPSQEIKTNFDAILPNFENKKVHFDIKEGQESLNLLVGIIYQSPKGYSSRRRLTIRIIEQKNNGDFLLHAHCHDYESPRTFLLSRVTSFVDLETGNLLPDLKLEISKKFSQKSKLELLKVFEDFKNEILVLIYFANCDSRMTKKELNVIANFIIDKCPKSTVDAAISNLRRMNCILFDFKKSLMKISKLETKSRKENLYKSIIEIIKTDKDVDENEQKALDLLREILH